MVGFYRHVADQSVLLSPALADFALLAPRLEAWIAVAELLGIPLEHRASLISEARWLHEAVHERAALADLYPAGAPTDLSDPSQPW